MLKKSLFTFVVWILAAGVLSSCSPDTPKAYAPPVDKKTDVVQDDNQQVFDPTVDILFVIDNSGSMGTHQANLAANVNKFTSAFTAGSVLDYNIGVVTTDNGDRWSSPTNCCGKLVGTTRIVNKNTINGDRVLAANFRVGTSGDTTEKVFDPTIAALTNPNLTGWNAGFYRPDATLAVIFITDAEDQSVDHHVVDTYNILLNMKNGDRSKVLGYGVIVPTDDATNCSRDEYGVTPLMIEEFLGMVANSKNRNNIMSLCDRDFGTRLAALAKDIVQNVGNMIYLNLPPARDSIKVTYGAAALPSDCVNDTGWCFNPKKNAIMLGSKINWSSQPSGSRVKVFYTAAKAQ